MPLGAAGEVAEEGAGAAAAEGGKKGSAGPAVALGGTGLAEASLGRNEGRGGDGTLMAATGLAVAAALPAAAFAWACGEEGKRVVCVGVLERVGGWVGGARGGYK